MLLSIACLDSNSFSLLAVNSEPLKTCMSDSLTEQKEKKGSLPHLLREVFCQAERKPTGQIPQLSQLCCKYQLSFIQGLPRFQHTKL